MEDEQLTRFTLRLPRELHGRITDSADSNNRSINAEMLHILAEGLEKAQEKEPEKGLLEQVLSTNLLWRVKHFQSREGITSPEIASRRLIRMALDEQESVSDILDKLGESYRRERDLRLLARDVIAAHSAVTEIRYTEDYVWFRGKDGQTGAIDKKGVLHCSEQGCDWEFMEEYSPIVVKEDVKTKVSTKKVSSSTSWDAPADGNLDDEIPF